MNKTQWHFHTKIHIFIVSCYANIYSSGLVKNKTWSDNLHYAACKQSFLRRSKRSQSRLRAFRACSNRSKRVLTNAPDRALSELTNGYLTPLGLPDLPYFTGAPVFQAVPPVSRLKPIRETLSAVFWLIWNLLRDLAVFVANISLLAMETDILQIVN